jgi:hypothetical protein
MDSRFLSFLNLSRWISALIVVMYHVRFLLFIDYELLHNKTILSKSFYFVTGLGHEAFAIFFVINGIAAGTLFLEESRQHQAGAVKNVVGRFARTYLALMPVLIFGGILDLVGARFFNGSGLYSDFPAFSTLTLSLSSFIGNLFMLQPFVVPTLGSNGMLYLLSYLWWSLCLMAILFAVSQWRKPLGNFVCAGLLGILVFAPSHFALWLAIWLLGIAVVLLCARSPARVPPLVGGILLVAATIFSRLVGSKGDLLPQPFGSLLLSWKYWFVGIGFATLAASMYRTANATNGPPAPPPGFARLNRRLGDFAPVTFFFHFPFMMLLTGAGADLLHEQLMQQPSAMLYLHFTSVVAACYGVTYFIAHRLDRMAIARAQTLMISRPQQAVQSPGTRSL